MTTHRTHLKTITAAATFAAASSLAGLALAAGSHAGGHGSHGDSPIGQAATMDQVTKTVTIDMTDNMRFTPANVQVTKGDVVHFIVKNSGAVQHEMTIGTPEELALHYQQMLKFPGMQHDDPQTASVAPNETGDIVWAFTTSGTVDFACLQPGHFDAGMKGYVQVNK